MRQDEARTWYVGLSRMSERLHLIYDAFPGAINHLPGGSRAASSGVHGTTDERSDGDGTECVDTVSRRVNGFGEPGVRCRGNRRVRRVGSARLGVQR